MGYQRDRENRERERRRDHRYQSPPRHRRRSRSVSQEAHRSRHRGYDNRQWQRKDERNHRHSRSRSREKRQQQNKQQQREQKIREAIRNQTIKYDTNIYELYMSLPQKTKAQLSQQANAPARIGQCILVRQLYVSGLQDANQIYVKNFFEKYGEIEDVEIIKNFVFVKYFKVEDACNACADYHTINTTLHNNNHNNNFKIFFADHLKRSNVVSNAPKYQNKDLLIPVLYASIKSDDYHANQDYLVSIFSKYGYIRNLQIKKNQLHTQRTYVLVQYQTLAQAMRARDKVKLIREKLGDKKSQITLLIDNNKIAQLFPNVSNQIRHQAKKRPLGTQSNVISQPRQLMPQQSHDPYSYIQQYQPQHQNQQQDLSHLMNIIGQFANPGALLEEDTRQADWSGSLTRNRQNKVEVDFIRIHKDPVELDGKLNITHRADWRQGIKGNYSMAGTFRAASTIYAQAFQEYVNYFLRKKKAGIVLTSKYLLYLIPPFDDPDINYPVKNNELLALIYLQPSQ